jgi:hypothetical protein
MTLQTNEPAVAPVTDGVIVIIDGFEITVPKGGAEGMISDLRTGGRGLLG